MATPRQQKKPAVKPVEENLAKFVIDGEEAILETVELKEGEFPTPDTIKPANATKTEVKPFEVVEAKLQIHENRILSVPVGTKKVTVENVGGGDLYVDINSLSFSVTTLLPIGEAKEFGDIERLFIGSASRPTFRVSYYK